MYVSTGRRRTGIYQNKEYPVQAGGRSVGWSDLFYWTGKHSWFRREVPVNLVLKVYPTKGARFAMSPVRHTPHPTQDGMCVVR